MPPPTGVPWMPKTNTAKRLKHSVTNTVKTIVVTNAAIERERKSQHEANTDKVTKNQSTKRYSTSSVFMKRSNILLPRSACPSSCLVTPHCGLGFQRAHKSVRPRDWEGFFTAREGGVVGGASGRGGHTVFVMAGANFRGGRTSLVSACPEIWNGHTVLRLCVPVFWNGRTVFSLAVPRFRNGCTVVSFGIPNFRNGRTPRFWPFPGFWVVKFSHFRPSRPTRPFAESPLSAGSGGRR